MRMAVLYIKSFHDGRILHIPALSTLSHATHCLRHILTSVSLENKLKTAFLEFYFETYLEWWEMV